MRCRHAAVLLALLALALLTAGCGAAGLGGDVTQPVEPDNARTPAPDFSAPALDGGPEVTLAAHRGRPVILNFWASWCAPCQKETPALVAFSKANPKVDVVGLAVNDQPSDSRRFATQKGVPYELGIDRDAEVASTFDVHALPVTVVIDAEGRIADTFPGEIARTQLDAYAAQLLTP